MPTISGGSDDDTLLSGTGYVFVPGVLTEQAALAGAAALGGQLLTIESADENARIAGWLTSLYPSSSAGEVWLGISDEASEGSWVYTSGPNTGTAITYSNWDTGQPSGGSENLAGLYIYTEKWNDFAPGTAGAGAGGSGPTYFLGNVVEYSAVDVLEGGGGTDTVSYRDATFGVSVSLAVSGAQYTGGGGTDTLVSIEGLKGSAYADSLTGDLGANVLEGGAGNDTLDGSGGTDTAVYSGAWQNYALTSLGGGSFTIKDTREGSPDGTDTVSGVESLSFSNGTFSAAYILAHAISGGSGNDVLGGTSGDDAILGLGGNDWIYGGQGNDTLDGGAGRDEVWYAGAGTYFPGISDTISVGVSVNLLTGTATGGAGTDTLIGIEDVVGSDFNDLLIGDDGANYLGGAKGNNIYDGGLGDDTIDDGDALGVGTAAYWSATSAVNVNLAAGHATGGGGNDTLLSVENAIGSNFNDTLTGSNGNNVLEGGAGNDTLDGSGGTDTAVYSGAWQNYTVTNIGGGSFTIRDNRAGSPDGTDTVSGVESLSFSNGTFSAADVFNDAPSATNDSNAQDAVVEAGGLSNGTIGDATATGNVLTNDGDADVGLGDVLAVDSARSGTEAAGGDLAPIAAETSIAGTYGTLSINTDGTYTYTLDDADSDTQALADGATGIDVFTYRVTDSHGATDLAELSLSISNTNDAPTVAHAIADRNATEDLAFSFTVPGNSFADVDVGDTLIYSATLSDDTPLPSWLSFDAATRAFSGTPLNGDVGTIHVKVTATDGSSASVSDTFDITVANTNDAPTVTSNGGGSTASVSIAENSTAVTTVVAPDVDVGDVVGFSLSGDDAALFAIDSNGHLAFKTAPDFEAPASKLGTNTYLVSVITSDGHGGSDSQDLTVSVTNLAGVTINGGIGSDVIDATHGIGGVFPTGEEDTLNGSGGNDAISGLGGNDVLNGGTGNDKLIGGAGNDTYYVDVAADVVQELAGQGTDTVHFTSTAANASYTLSNSATTGFIENLALDGTASIRGVGNDQNNVMTGNSGNNSLSGGNGNDTLNGGRGTDILVGGAGNDTYFIDATGSKTITEASGGGIDIVLSAFTHTLAANVENLTLTGSSNINGIGNASSNVMIGNSGNNSIDGGTGNDVLSGLGGNDTLNGGTGADTLIGGTGNDRFVFLAVSDSAPASSDRIADFQHGQDIIDLRSIDSNVSMRGDQAFNFAGQNARTIGHSVPWYEVNGHTVVQADVNGNTTADFSVVLTGVGLGLVGSDFIL